MVNDMLWNMGMRKVFSITKAKAEFSKLLQRVAAGEEFKITKRGVAVARLVPLEAKKRQAATWFFMRGNSRSRTTLMRPSPKRFLTRLRAKRSRAGGRHEISGQRQRVVVECFSQ
jgi:prevent-host-death family protein